MAVAAHVSRVAKDYAPHGYSITRTNTQGVNAASGGINGGGSDRSTLTWCDNGDVYLKKVTFFSQYDTSAPVVDDPGHHWVLEIVADPMDGSPATVLASVSTDSFAGAMIGKFSFEVMVPVVVAPRTIGINFTETSGAGAGTQKDIDGLLYIEYNSKA